MPGSRLKHIRFTEQQVVPAIALSACANALCGFDGKLIARHPDKSIEANQRHAIAQKPVCVLKPVVTVYDVIADHMARYRQPRKPFDDLPAYVAPQAAF